MWSLTVDAQPGPRHVPLGLGCTGATHPDSPASLWNPRGYAKNAWAHVTASVMTRDRTISRDRQARQHGTAPSAKLLPAEGRPDFPPMAASARRHAGRTAQRTTSDTSGSWSAAACSMAAPTVS